MCYVLSQIRNPQSLIRSRKSQEINSLRSLVDQANMDESDLHRCS